MYTAALSRRRWRTTGKKMMISWWGCVCLHKNLVGGLNIIDNPLRWVKTLKVLGTQCVGLGRRGRTPYIEASERWVPSSGSNKKADRSHDARLVPRGRSTRMDSK